MCHNIFVYQLRITESLKEHWGLHKFTKCKTKTEEDNVKL